ncbi:Cutinase transcription factor 1 beta-like protein [Cladobotryum mycophilum]|uniref:Cutinase transcription factor 1 beta-like protein n=1 Tax=Cladobotryum mycophilum TaxID=491253 RepID=A0ABR0S7V6_9HYPO
MDGDNSSAPAVRRRRARKACLRCRQRKVRCDVTLRGVPCLNCHLDSEVCAVQARKPKSKSQKTKQQPDCSSHHVSHDHAAVHLPNGEESSGADGLESLAQVFDGEAVPTNDFIAPESLVVNDFNIEGTDDVESGSRTDGPPSVTPPDSTLLDPPSAGIATRTNPGGGNNLPFEQVVPPETELGHISYETLPFIKHPTLGHVESLDLRFMQLNGCFDLPPMSILNELIKIYFLHVHPIVPLLNEGDFWDSYHGLIPDQVPLLVLQSMIFAACTFMPGHMSEAIGFDAPRSAAAAFYKRTKILYDFELEPEPVAMAQACILLTLWPGSLRPGPTKTNTRWLSRGIAHAKSLRAQTLFSDTANVSSLKSKMLRRLWWCCLIRDRTISLGLRRPLQVTEKYPILRPDDFDDEMHRSRVYSHESKKNLCDIFLQISQLCMILTNLLRWSVGSEDGMDCPLARNQCQMELADCAASLREWHGEVRLRLPKLDQRRELQPNSVIVQVSLMYIATKLALHHQEIISSVHQLKPGFTERMVLAGKSAEVRDTVDHLIKHLAEPVRLGLSQYLPSTVVAFAAVPLMIHVVNAKFSFRGIKSHRTAANHDQLCRLISLIKLCHPRFCGVDIVCLLIRRLVDLAESGLISEQSTQVADCIDLIDHKPSEYLRLLLELDSGLNNAVLPQNYEHPNADERSFTDGDSSSNSVDVSMGDNAQPLGSPSQVFMSSFLLDAAMHDFNAHDVDTHRMEMEAWVTEESVTGMDDLFQMESPVDTMLGGLINDRNGINLGISTF